MLVASFQLASQSRYRANAIDVERDADLMTIYRQSGHVIDALFTGHRPNVKRFLSRNSNSNNNNNLTAQSTIQ